MNLNAAAIRAVYEGAIAGRDVSAADSAIKAFRKIVQDAGLVPPMKAALAVRSGDKRWLRLRAPLRDGTAEEGSHLLAHLGSAADHIGR
jgi:4-hydroxy-tetrahydrodipicolinate synthase